MTKQSERDEAPGRLCACCGVRPATLPSLLYECVRYCEPCVKEAAIQCFGSLIPHVADSTPILNQVKKGGFTGETFTEPIDYRDPPEHHRSAFPASSEVRETNQND